MTEREPNSPTPNHRHPSSPQPPSPAASPSPRIRASPKRVSALVQEGSLPPIQKTASFTSVSFKEQESGRKKTSKMKKRYGPAPQPLEERHHSPQSSAGKEHPSCAHHYRQPSSPVSRTKDHSEYIKQLYLEEDQRRQKERKHRDIKDTRKMKKSTAKCSELLDNLKDGIA